MLAFLAQTFTDTEDPTGLLNMIWPLVAGVIIPFIVARATTAETASRIKTYVSLGLAGLAGVLSVVGTDWSGVTIVDVLYRAGGAFTVAEMVYRKVDDYMVQRSIDDGGIPAGLNEHPTFKPEKGLI